MTNKIQQLHKQMPRALQTEVNPNWKALIEGIGESDQNISDLIEQVRKQFFLKTATRPYIDRLGTRSLVQRPRFVGMSDESFREFIPVMSYSPKQVKLVFDKLLDLFFFKESTTSYVEADAYEPYSLEDGWTLEYDIDSYRTERIEFYASDFTDITKATANEIVAAINRQAQYSYAIPVEDNITKQIFIRLFTVTVGSKGSIGVTGGLANIALKFTQFNNTAGQTGNTQWLVTRVGETMTFQYVGGGDPLLRSIADGDIALINLPGNIGSFVITNVDASTQTFSFNNTFGSVGAYTESGIMSWVDWDIAVTYGIGDVVNFDGAFYKSLIVGNLGNDPTLTPAAWASTNNEVIRFMEAHVAHIYKNDRRAIAWEVAPGEITVEIPPTPPVVKRNRKGAAHINGTVGVMTGRVDATSLTFNDNAPLGASAWNIATTYSKGDIAIYSDIYYSSVGSNNIGNTPSSTSEQWVSDYIGFPVAGGKFTITKLGESWNEIPLESTTTVMNFNTRYSSDQPTYTYTSRVGNTLLGITPDLPETASLNKVNLISANRVSDVLTVATATPHNFLVDDFMIVEGAVEGIGAVPINGAWQVTEVIDTTHALCASLGDDRTSTGGTGKVERLAMANSGSLITLTTSTVQPRRTGPYLWDVDAQYVLSSQTTKLTAKIDSGTALRSILVNPNDINNSEGYLIFDFGTSKEEGPVRYFFKPSSQTIAIDPSYVFEFSHSVGASVTRINRRGGIQFAGDGRELAPYITDPSAARLVLKELMEEVKSVGIFLNFLVRYPTQYYATQDVYFSGIDPG